VRLSIFPRIRTNIWFRFDLVNERLFRVFFLFLSKATKVSFTSVSISRVPRRRKRFRGAKKTVFRLLRTSTSLSGGLLGRDSSLVAMAGWLDLVLMQDTSRDTTRRMHPGQVILINTSRAATCDV
jgi:hypothetical protein